MACWGCCLPGRGQAPGKELLSHNLLGSGQAFAFGALNAVSLFTNKKEATAKRISSAARLPSARLPRDDTVLGQQLNTTVHGREATDAARSSPCSPASIYPCCIQEGLASSDPQFEPATVGSSLSTNLGSRSLRGLITGGQRSAHLTI